MTKNKKTKAKAPAQAKVAPEIAPPAIAAKTPAAKPVVAKTVEPVKPVQAVKPVETVKPVPAVKSVAAVKPVEIAKPVPAAKPAAIATPVVAPTPAPAPAPAQPKVRLEFSKPGAHSVAIAGSFNSWQPEQASATTNGAWVKELTIGPGRYEYMFVVDGQWMADPNAKEFTPNPFGGQNSVLVINK